MRKFLAKENIIVFILSVLYILANAKLYLMGFEWMWLLPIVMLVFLFAVFSLDILMFFLVFLVPLSIPLYRLVEGLSFNLMLPTEPIILGITFLFILKVIKEDYFDNRIIFHPVTIAIFFYLFWILVTCFSSELPSVSFKFLASRFWYVVVFYIIASQLFKKYSNIIKYAWCYAIGLTLVAGFAISQFLIIGITKHQQASHVVYPFFNDHTDYATAIAMILVFVCGMIFIRNKVSPIKKSVYISFALFFLVALILSYTRASWLSLVIAFCFLIALLLKIRLRVIFLILGIFLGLFLFFKADILIALERNTQDSDKSISKHLLSMTNISTDASNMERLNRWGCALRMFEDRPLLGFGPGTYQFLYAGYQKRSEKTIISTTRGDVGNAHSEFLGPLAESGILGTVSFVLIIITTLATAGKLYFRSRRRKVKLLALTLLIGLLSYYAHGFMNNFLDTDKLSALFWGFTAMIVALDVYHSHDLKEIETKRTSQQLTDEVSL